MNKISRTTALFAAAAISLSAAAFPAYAEKSKAAEESSVPVDYSDKSNWAFWDYGGDEKPADLFIICPTIDMGDGGNYNSDITDENIKSGFVGALNMELGIYTDTASVYSPYYRQITFSAYSLGEEEREPYLQLAYNDVRDAFMYYCGSCDESRPLILAGFSQGSDMLIRLMSEFFGEEKYSDRLVAAYAVGWNLTEEQTEKYPWLKPAQGEEDTGVIVLFNSEAEHVTSSLMIGENVHTYAINPLNWKTDSTPADKSLNKGACFTDYSGNITSEIPGLTGAYIDEKRGALKVPDINEADFPALIFDEGIFHIYDYQFFYRDLQENVAKRTAAFMSERTDEPQPANYSLSLKAEPDREESFVGDDFYVMVTLKNTGDADLTNVTIDFETLTIQTLEKVPAGKEMKLRVKLKAEESDIESGGKLDIYVYADELDEPEKATITVKVKPVEENPATGADSTMVFLFAVSGLAAIASRKRTK